MGASSLIVLIIAAITFSGIAILVSKFVLKATTNKQKGEPYECGVPTRGKTWVQLNVGYYLFALIFLIFVKNLICFIKNTIFWHQKKKISEST